MLDADKWLSKLANLRVDRASGDPAPHKPLLLLAILELAEQALVPADRLALSPELAFRFLAYWKIVAHRRRQRPDIRLPFHYLQSDGFWTALAEHGQPSPDNRLTRYAALNAEFAALVIDPSFRERARRVLIAKYFRPAERVALYTLVGMPTPSDDEIARDAGYQSAEEAAKEGRDARFRLTVVPAYDYTCALTGYRLTTITAGTIVDAAHIHRFADSRNNDPRNGIALCKNAHWLFDQGLWSLTDDYCVLVAVGRYAEDHGDLRPLAQYHGAKIRLPINPAFWPDTVCLAWHRKKKLNA